MTVRRVVVEVDGRPASFRETGAGPAAIVTAGLGLTGRFYRESFAAFAGAGIRLVIPDLPGWGETPGPRTGLDPHRTAAFLAAFADRLGIDRAVWIGHSLGAQAVTLLAGQQPHRARGLVLVGPTGDRGRFVLARQALGLGREATRTSFGVIRAVARDYLSTSPVRYIGTWLRHARDDMPARLGRIRCPTLIVVGDADPVCRPDFVERLRHAIPHARVERVPGGTHALPRGHADRFNRTVVPFARRVSMGAEPGWP